MRPLHLFVAAGDGTIGPDRVFPLPPPPASIKSLLATTVGTGEKKICLQIISLPKTAVFCGDESMNGDIN